MYDLKEIFTNKPDEVLESFREDLLKLHKKADNAEYHMFEEVIGSVLEDLKIIEPEE